MPTSAGSPSHPHYLGLYHNGKFIRVAKSNLPCA